MGVWAARRRLGEQRALATRRLSGGAKRRPLQVRVGRRELNGGTVAAWARLSLSRSRWSRWPPTNWQPSAGGSTSSTRRGGTASWRQTRARASSTPSPTKLLGPTNPASALRFEALRHSSVLGADARSLLSYS